MSDRFWLLDSDADVETLVAWRARAVLDSGRPGARGEQAARAAVQLGDEIGRRRA